MLLYTVKFDLAEITQKKSRTAVKRCQLSYKERSIICGEKKNLPEGIVKMIEKLL